PPQGSYRHSQEDSTGESDRKRRYPGNPRGARRSWRISLSSGTAHFRLRLSIPSIISTDGSLETRDAPRRALVTRMDGGSVMKRVSSTCQGTRFCDSLPIHTLGVLGLYEYLGHLSRSP